MAGTPPVVPPDLTKLLEIAAAAAARRAPVLQVEKGARHKSYREFLRKANPSAVHNLALAHTITLEAVAWFANYLEQLACICPAGVDSGTHLEVCPKAIRAHGFFERFNFTASADAGAEQPAEETPAPASQP